MKNTKHSALLTIVAGISAMAADSAIAENMSPNYEPSSTASEIHDAFLNGDVRLRFRARHEYNNHGDEAHGGRANTLGSRLTYNTADICGIHGVLEFNNTSSYWDTRHNSGNSTTPANAGFAVIPDAKGSAVTAAYININGWNNTNLKIGRQKIILDNGRFVSDYDFRQTPQSFDAITVTSRALPDLELFYGYLHQFNTIYQNNALAVSGHHGQDSHLLNGSYTGFDLGKLTAYGYFVDDRINAAGSNFTYGLRLSGDLPINDISLAYGAEIARQHDYAGNKANYHANFYSLDGKVNWGPFAVKAGYDVFEGDNSTAGRSFQTTLGDKHSFNGKADVFMVTPAAGLTDLHAGATVKVWDVVASADFHTFNAESGSTHYGTEWDFGVKTTFEKHYSLGFEYATFSGSTAVGGGNNDKFWVTATANFA